MKCINKLVVLDREILRAYDKLAADKDDLVIKTSRTIDALLAEKTKVLASE